MTTFDLPSSLRVDFNKLDGKLMAKIAETADGANNDPFTSVLSACWAQTEDVGPYAFVQLGDAYPEIRRLLKGDVLRSFVAIRQISMPEGEGDDYDFDTRCEECGSRIAWNVQLSKIPVKLLSPEAIERVRAGRPFSTKGPDGADLHFHLQTLAQEDEVKKLLRQQKRKKATVVDVLTSQTVSVGGVTDVRARWRYFSGLSMGELMQTQRAYEEPDCGLETSIEIACPSCGWEQETAIPFGRRSFFSLKRRTAKTIQAALDEWSGPSGARSASPGGTTSAPASAGGNTEVAASG